MEEQRDWVEAMRQEELPARVLLERTEEREEPEPLPTQEVLRV